MAGPVVFVLKGYPRLSETFIAQEILALEKRGLDIHLFSLRHPTDEKRHPIHDEIQAPVTYLPEYLRDEPKRVFAAWRRARKLPGYIKAKKIWRRDYARDRQQGQGRNRARRFGQAMVLATSLPRETERIHAHFLHTPASVARYAAIMTGLPWSASAHAKDIWTSPEWEKREKLADIDWLATCTRFGADHLKALSPLPEKVNLVYHGIDLERFPATGHTTSNRDGSDPDNPVRLLAVGRAVPKKGLDILLSALAALPRDRHWSLTHIGGGPELDRLKAQAASLNLTGRIDWSGPQDQEVVLEAYRASDLFVLPSVVTGDGDRDGLPNVLMEAQSQGLCCISTNISGIPELIDHLKTGYLVNSGDIQGLTVALSALIEEPAARIEYGLNGQKRVREVFDARMTIGQLADLFGLAP